MNYYEHHLGDWAAATGHLTWDEDMAYTRLLRAYYHHEKPIAQGQQYRLAKASTPVQRRAVDQVLQEFFELRDGHYHQKRADAEIARYQDKQAKAKRSAEARWNSREPQSERNANASPDAMRTHSEGNALQTPDTRHQSREEGEKAPTTVAADAAPPSSRPQRGARLPAGWSPGPEQTAFAESLGIRNGVAAAELEKFRDYWAALPGQKGVKTDWTATWRNWLRRKAEDMGGKPAGSGGDIFAGAE